MKKQLLTIRMLLVVAMLCLGVNVTWATTLGDGSLGKTDFTTEFNTTYSDAVSIPVNNTATITFVNHSNKSSNYANWAMALSNDVDHGGAGYLEYVYLRADAWFWNPSFNKNQPVWYTSYQDNFVWSEFQSHMDGANMTITITRKGSIVNIHAVAEKSGTEYYEDLSLFCGTGTQTIRAYMTCQQAYLTDLAYSVAATSGSASDEGWATCNASIDFSNAISNGSVAGAVNSMVLSNTAGSNIFELGYTYTPKKEKEEDPDPDPVTVLGDVLRVGNGSGTVTIPAAQRAGYGESDKRDIVYISFDMYYGNLSGKNAGFYVKDSEGNKVGAYYVNKYNSSIADDDMGIGSSNVNSIGSGSNENNVIYANNNKTTFFLVFDYSTGTMKAYMNSKGDTSWTTEAVSMLTMTNPIATFEVSSNYNNDGRRCWFDNLTIHTVRGDYSISEVGYTLKFVDANGTAVKGNETSRTALPGTGISALATTADQTTFYNDGDIANNTTTEFPEATNKYVYKSVSAVTSSVDETPITELVDGAVVTIVYDKYNKYDYTISQKLGTNAPTSLQSGTKWEDQTVRYYYPVCVKSGDDYYVTTKNVAEPYFGVTVTSENATHTINYTLDNRIVYYAESENMEGSRYKDLQAASRTSNGSSWCSAASNNSYVATNWTVTANGNYDIEVGMANRNYSVSPAPQLKSGAAADPTVTLGTISLGSNSYDVKDYINQPINAGDQLYFYNDNGSNASKWALDYVILRNIPATITATIGSTGYTTFASSYPLDLSNLPDGITAYTASVVGESEVTFTPATTAVAAGTGLLLKGTADTSYDIPVVASGETISGNKMVGCPTATDLTTPSESYYVLVNNDGTAEFRPLTGSYTNDKVTIPAGKAYLDVNAGTAARALSIALDNGEVTGINTIQKSEFKVQGCYNLNGQRVAQPTKGLYIIDGRKVVVK